MTFSLFTRRAVTVLNSLAEPDVPLFTIQREKARLLALLTLVLLAVAVVILLPIGLLNAPPTAAQTHVASVVITSIVMLIIYGLSKRGHLYEAGSLLLVYGTAFLFFIAITRENTLILFLLIAILLFANLFFSATVGVIVFFVHVVMIQFLPAIIGMPGLIAKIERPLTYYILSAIIAITYSAARDYMEIRRQSLPASQLRFRNLIERAFYSLYLFEPVYDAHHNVVDFRVVSRSARYERTTKPQGQAYDESSLDALNARWNVTDLHEKLRHVLSTGEPYEDDVYVTIGTPRWFHIQAVRIENNVALFSQDITRWKTAEQQHAESEDRYRLISEVVVGYAFSMHFDADNNAVVDWITDTFSRFSGYTLDEMKEIGLPQFYHPDDQARVFADLELVRQGASAANDYRVILKSGETRWIHLTRWPKWDEQKERVTGYYGVAQDITERRLIEKAERDRERLRIALDTEREMNAMKNKLMLTISHEFRTPLATIQASSELLHRYFSRMSSEQREAQSRIIRLQVQHLSDMLEDISFALHNASSMNELKREPVNLEAMCRETIEDTRYAIHEKLKISLDSDPPHLELNADPKLMKRIVRNLITNAIKYSPEGGEICIGLKEEGNEVVLRVQDEGIGISPEDQAQIFQPFFRAENSSIAEGTGVGLSIVYDCVALHGGAITVESELGKGTTFIVRLPRG